MCFWDMSQEIRVLLASMPMLTCKCKCAARMWVLQAYVNNKLHLKSDIAMNVRAKAIFLMPEPTFNSKLKMAWKNYPVQNSSHTQMAGHVVHACIFLTSLIGQIAKATDIMQI